MKLRPSTRLFHHQLCLRTGERAPSFSGYWSPHQSYRLYSRRSSEDRRGSVSQLGTLADRATGVLPNPSGENEGKRIRYGNAYRPFSSAGVRRALVCGWPGDAAGHQKWHLCRNSCFIRRAHWAGCCRTITCNEHGPCRLTGQSAQRVLCEKITAKVHSCNNY